MNPGPLPLQRPIKFGADCELDPASYELRRAGRVLKLERIPAEILLLLVERRGELVTRDQIAERIWGKEVFLDTDNSINGAIRKIRQALKDDPESPRFIQTITGRGYRFIGPRPEAEPAPPALTAPTQMADSGPATAGVAAAPAADAAENLTPPAKSKTLPWLAITGILVLLVAAAAVWFFRSRSPVATLPSTHRVVLAVLPFENLTGDPSQDYFVDGITEQMITEIGSRNPEHLAVIGRTSVMAYKHNPKPLAQVGRELGVQYVLEGSVRRDQAEVRVSAQLIRVADQTEVWTRQYDRELKDVLRLQSEIAGDTSNGIGAALGEQSPIAPADQLSLTPSAYQSYELYLKGQFFWNKRNGDALERAIDYFQQAIDKDPNNARAYAGLADSYALLGGYSGVEKPEYGPRAKAAALRAMEIDPNLAEAHTAFALVTENYDWHWQQAEQEYQRAIALNPSYATAHQWYAEYLTWQGRFDEALKESDRARQLDPLSLIIAADRGAIFFYSRQYDRAIQELAHVRDMDPNFARSGVIISAYAEKGMMEQAFAAAGPTSDAPWFWGTEAFLFSRSGRPADAQHALDRLLQLQRRQLVDIRCMVLAEVSTGNNDQAMAWLERAYKEQPNALTTLKVDPVYDPLRSDPRFQDLLKRVGLAK